MTSSIQLWHLLVAFAAVGLVMLLLRRWSSRFSFGVVGLVLIILPGAFAYFSPHHLSIAEALSPVVGAVILGADLTGRFPRRGGDR
jgi:hypothetical protein